MQTIKTKYLGPTNYKGSRIKASLASYRPDGGSNPTVTIPFDYGAEDHGHGEACRKLAAKMDWSGEMVGGHTADGMVWVFVGGCSPRVTP